MPVRVVNVKTPPTLKEGEELVYVANVMPGWEASPLGKPYYMAEHDDPLASYRAWLLDKLREKGSKQRQELVRIARMVADGEQVALGCWCKPKRCHGDFLRELVEGTAAKIKKKRHLHVLEGDATQPQGGTEDKIIVHVCNDKGGWGAGFVLALSRKWPGPERAYRKLQKYELGRVQFIEVEFGVWVANMIAQHGYRHVDGVPPIRYDAVEDCLLKVAQWAEDRGASVHMPRIGCGLAGGKWPDIEERVARTLLARGIDTYVYDFRG